MASFLQTVLALPSGTTGNVNGASVSVPPEVEQIAVQYVVEAVGATPTVTFVTQVSLDGTNWFAALTLGDTNDTPAASSKTMTAVGVQHEYIDLGVARDWPFLRVVTSANTNSTVRAEVYFHNGSS